MTLSETWIDFIAGWASGAMAVLTCQPVDTVLTRLQAGDALVVGSASSNVRVQTRGLIQNFGITSLWRGSSAMISAVPIQNALLMGGYGIGKQWAVTHHDSTQSATLASVFVGGCTGGVVQSFLMSPVELVKVNQQVHVTKTARMATQELWKGFFTNRTSWRGLNATMLRDGIPHGVWFASYEWCKTTMLTATSTMNDDRNDDHGGGGGALQHVVTPMASGAFAATVAWAVGYPFDIIKTRIQATPQQQGIYATALELMQEGNGIAGLYRGFGLKLVRAVPASMVGFLTYETVAGFIRNSSN